MFLKIIYKNKENQRNVKRKGKTRRIKNIGIFEKERRNDFDEKNEGRTEI